MGIFSNLELVWPSTALDIPSAEEHRANRELGLLVLLAVWGIAMIWSITLLVDRWRGPMGNRAVGFGSVLAAFILSTMWPIVFAYLFFSA